VRGLALGLGLLAVGVAVVLAMLMALSAAPRGRLVDGYVLFLGALLLFGLVRATRSAAAAEEGSAFEDAQRRRARRPERPRELAKLEREVVLASTSAFDLHIRLRPILRDVAAHRLATRRGLELDSGSGPVRAALGSELWDIVRPDRSPPDDRLGPGLSLRRLRSALDVLERI
jgi:hypothetical protein